MLSAAFTALPLSTLISNRHQSSSIISNRHQSPSIIHPFLISNTKPTFLVHFNLPNQKNPSESIKLHVKCSSSYSSNWSSSSDPNLHPQEQQQEQKYEGFWGKWRANSAELSDKVAKLGLAAVLAYGLFDGVTYTTFFVMAFLGYEKSTGNNPAANLKALIGIVLLMWAGNNVTRPFRVAGAAALAPVIDKGLRKVQKALNFPSLVYAFALVAGIVAASCFAVAGLLVLSRWGA